MTFYVSVTGWTVVLASGNPVSGKTKYLIKNTVLSATPSQLPSLVFPIPESCLNQTL